MKQTNRKKNYRNPQPGIMQRTLSPNWNDSINFLPLGVKETQRTGGRKNLKAENLKIEDNQKPRASKSARLTQI